MSLVSGEDSESDEEINTEQFGNTQQSNHTGSPRVGIIQGEDDEDETDGKTGDNVSSGSLSVDAESGLNMTVTMAAAKKWEPPSVLHKKLGETNYSLRRNIVIRLTQLYQNTCRNLTIVNDNLTKAQHVIEKVNTNIKRSDQDLVLLKTQCDDIFNTSNGVAAGITITIAQQKIGTASKTEVS